MEILARDFLPRDLEPLLRANGFDSCVAVQARQDVPETDWLLDLADANPTIKGVVGWVDLCSEQLSSQIDQRDHPKLVGYRHILQSEPDDRYMLRPEFVQGLRCLARLGKTFDLLVFPRHLPFACQLVDQVPDLKIVIDHCAKPLIKTGESLGWMADMEIMARNPNCYCKLSGLATEGDWTNWSNTDLQPYVDAVLNVFGPDRVMFGSDWPVCLLATSYERWVDSVQSLVPSDWHDKVCGQTARAFYGLA